MKDIENYKLVQVQSALGRLDRALTRLESAATKTGNAGETKALKEKLDQLSRDHGALQETAGRVATRLDTAIERLAASIQD